MKENLQGPSASAHDRAGVSFKAVKRDDRRATILAVAREVFFEHGYADASMSMIAARLGGSKGTLYNYFENKKALFTAYVEDTCQRFGDEVFGAWRDDAPLEPALTSLARRYIEFFSREDTVRTFRLVVAESQRSPELAEIFNEAGPANGRRRLAEKLATAASLDLIDAPDPVMAARQFFALCKGGAYFDRLLNLVPPPTKSAVDAEAESVTATFLRAYAATGGSAPSPTPASAPAARRE
jgi:AcrR family transcriptional regulator